MTNRYIAVIDAGSSSLRCFVFDQNGRIVGSRSAEWSYASPPDASDYAREFDPDAVWRDIGELLIDALSDSGAGPGQVAAVTATSQRQSLVFLDSEGRELYAGPNLDLRAVFEGGAIDDQMKRKVYQTTGHTPSFLLAQAKLRWFQLHRPEAYDRIASVITLADWVLFRLSGELMSEPTLAAESGLLDIHSRRRCTGLHRDLGLFENSDVPLVEAASMAGRVTRSASRQTGVPIGTPVVVSGSDTQCGLLGMGVARERQVGIVSGWSAPLQLVTVQPIMSVEYSTWAGCHLMPDRWVVESNAGDVGNSYRWLAGTLFGHRVAFADMDKLASAVPVASEGTLAFLGPSRMEMDSPGLRRGGFLFPVPLTLNQTNRGHLVRAALEAAAYALKANLLQAESTAGETAEDISVGGGMVQTATFVKALADVLGRQIRVPSDPQVSALGAYLCAATALGQFASLDEAAEVIAMDLRSVEPEPLASTEYRELYERWVEVSGQLETIGL